MCTCIIEFINIYVCIHIDIYLQFLQVINAGYLTDPHDLKTLVSGSMKAYEVYIYIYMYIYIPIFMYFIRVHKSITHLLYIFPTVCSIVINFHSCIFIKLGVAMKYGPMLVPQDLKHLPLNKTEVNKSLNVQIYTYIYIHIYIYMYIHIYVCLYIYTCFTLFN
jgi:hypothetical protein